MIERLCPMDIEKWLSQEVDRVAKTGVSETVMTSFVMKTLARARKSGIRAHEMTILLTNALIKSSISIIEDAWIECGCRHAEMVLRIRDKIGHEQTIELRV
jgi:hypothetical protein